MNKVIGFFGACLLLTAVGCNYEGVPVAFAGACDKANDDTTIEVNGYFKNSGSSMCSKSGNSPMRCPIEFAETPDSEEDLIRSELDLGSGASSIEDVEGKGLTIHDMNGDVVKNSEKVKMTANAHVFDEPRRDKKLQNCYVTVKKVEKVK